MPTVFVNALWITLIGMGLVFIAILALWGMMALLVRLTTEKEPVEAEVVAAETEETSLSGAASSDRKRRAAAAAVAFALLRQNLSKPVHLPEPAASVSAWQAVNRASQISQRIYSSRKKVVR